MVKVITESNCKCFNFCPKMCNGPATECNLIANIYRKRGNVNQLSDRSPLTEYMSTSDVVIMVILVMLLVLMPFIVAGIFRYG